MMVKITDYGAGLPPGARMLGSYAASAVPSRGRCFPEGDCPTRAAFQRDRDRVLHSAPFRRLTYKTQVFLFHEGDHYRTRLTHSLEVAQIARTVARQLCLDEDLAEVLALAHDLGHSPFGHAGERALDKAMSDIGGFNHNAQSLRIVTQLERKYLSFDGLNLTWETVDGLAKHNGPIAAEKNNAVVQLMRDLERDWRDFELDKYASGEAQVAALADDIAYLNHDIDDGLRAGLITLQDLSEVPVARVAVHAATQAGDAGAMGVGDDAAQARLMYEVSRRMITVMIADCVTETRTRLADLAPQGPDDIRASNRAVVAFTAKMTENLEVLRAFLFRSVYRHAKVMNVMEGAEKIVSELYRRYLDHPQEMESHWHDAGRSLTVEKRARLTGDFVAGMTDRFAIAEHRRLFDDTPELR